MSKFTAAEWIAIIGAMAALVGAIGTTGVLLMNAIKGIHRDINSRMDQFLAEARKASLAEGRDQMRLSVAAPAEVSPVVEVKPII